ncbi:MAG: insulinase family protein [Robiginitomaculum sp.]|nr:insulinase family protein [Robiginitomaculum sp.]
MRVGNYFTKISVGAVVIFGLASCTGDSVDTVVPPQTLATKSTKVQFEKYTLANGLDVVLHVDRSDPIVAINLAVHVGSSRELPGRTGFAHLFEHLLFLDSENLGYGGLDLMNTRIGGEGTNGFTTNDMTQYFQAVPKDALEKVIWAEADKIGYFINTVTTTVIDKEKQVVKNEKRQRVDNQPYGHRWYIIGKALYGADHPYNWQVIGSLADLEAADLEDVQNFYKKWYVPNNVTVTLTGDFDVAQAKQWIDKYFAEIPRGADIAKIAPRPSGIAKTASLYYEDNFATVPEFTMVWPTVPQYHPDSYALNVLATYLGDGKRAPLNEVLIDEEKVTSSVQLFTNFAEVAGEFYMLIDAKEGEDIDGLQAGIKKAFARFEANGITQADLDMIKTAQEVDFYDNLQSALGKAIQLGQYNVFTDDPGFINMDLKNMQAVTTADVMRVYETYIKDKPRVMTSIVPKGQMELTLEGAKLAEIIEEKVVQGAEKTVEEAEDKRDFPRTASSFDRTIEPPFGAAYDLPTPDIWKTSFGNGIEAYGIESDETQLVYFSLAIDAGRERGDTAKPGVANLTADMLEKGTAGKTTAQLEDAIKALGSTINISAGAEKTVFSGNTLARNFDATIALLEEMLLEPRWDAEEFALLKTEKIDAIITAEGNPNAIARRESLKLRYPEDHMFSYTPYGSKERLEAVELADIKAFYAANYAPARAQLRVVGAVDSDAVQQAFSGVAKRWTRAATDDVTLPQSADITTSKIYFYDVPGAKQSVLRIERPSLPATHADYPLARAINFPLGGIYTSELMTELRVNKGYTYGIRSSFSGGVDRGVFAVGSSVRTNVTLESLELIRDIVKNYGPNFTDEDLATMKQALLRGQALKSETLSDKLNMVSEISAYGYEDDYRAKTAKRIEAMTLAEFKSLADKYLRPDAMFYLVVGDAKTQFGRLKDLGYGEAVLLNPDVESK